MKDIEIGDKVEVFSANMKDNLGDGVYLGDVETPMGSSPEINLDNGETIYGFECWWMPKVEAERIKKEQSHDEG